MRFCCASKMWTVSEAREPEAYRDSSNRLLGGCPEQLKHLYAIIPKSQQKNPSRKHRKGGETNDQRHADYVH